MMLKAIINMPVNILVNKGGLSLLHSVGSSAMSAAH